MSSIGQTHSGGVGFCGALAILFIALKLTGNIAWSWWWVLSPLWGWFMLSLLVGIPMLILIKWLEEQ